MTKFGTAAARAAGPVRDRSRAIGPILVEHGRLTPDEAERIQVYADKNSLRFGEAALQMQLLNQSDIDLAISHQFNHQVLQRGVDGVSDELIAAYSPESQAVEPLRALRSILSLRRAGEAEKKILAITSPGRSEGRSWLAANLATVFAQKGERTMLIDADMRHPRQHKLFNLDNSVGLSALLTGRAGREIVARIHPRLRLFVLPAGVLPPNPQELLARPVFDVILSLFADQFDLIIIDTPAASESADAQILAARAGAAIMIARRNYTRRREFRTAMSNMVHSGANVIGTVVNEF